MVRSAELSSVSVARQHLLDYFADLTQTTIVIKHLPASMSASWNKKVINLPPLPNETWLQILEPPLDTAEEQREIRMSLVTKRYLVRVCKRWHALAMPLLYESVYIGRVRSLLSLRDNLVASQRQETEGSIACALGLWVRRLDVAVRDFHGQPNDSWPLPDIINCLPKLRILIMVTKRPSLFPPTLLAIGKTCGSSLQKLMCNTYTSTLCQGETGFRDLRNLRTLITGPVFDQNWAAVCPFAMTLSPGCDFVTLPNIRARPHVHEGLDDGCTSFPFFRQARICLSVSEAHLSPCVLEMLAVRGSKLTTTYLDLTSKNSVKSVTGALKKHCPRLAHIIIVVDSWYTFLHESSVDPQFPPITHLGLSCRENQTRHSTYNSIFRYLVDFAPRTLEVVRFLNPRGVADLRDHHSEALVVGASQLRKLGIRVEDHEGNDLTRGGFAGVSS
ncbi:hypothetical protein EW146_g9787 [Bondarzewia mesenterica]|uniref:Uncharacterized protein n=1 Tax=Bondarzewia mesenterica TaxID=1095465 RepID=A0A4S4L3G3_9AGAM|nr:hypothetical protein EW146_g9787 [Bondarzewia mesenterica]